MKLVFCKYFTFVVMLASLVTLSGVAQASNQDGQLLLIEKGTAQERRLPIDGQVRIDVDGDVHIKIDEVLASGGTRVDQPTLSIVGISSDLAIFTITGSSAPIIRFDWASRGAYRCVGIGTLPGWSDRVNLPAYRDFLSSEQRSLAQVGTSDLGPCNDYTAGIRCNNGSVSRESELLNIRVEQAGQC